MRSYYKYRKRLYKQILSIIVLLISSRITKGQEVIRLQPGSDLPRLTVFQPKQNTTKGTAVIICPGGSYAYRADENEGTGPAQKLSEAGISAFVLDYRLPDGNDTIPLHDAQAAIRYLRAHCKEYKLSKNRIGIMGFSAGGHLTSTAGTHFHDETDRPDFMVLGYAVISMQPKLTHAGSRDNLLGSNPDTAKVNFYSNELRVKDNTPSTFIMFTLDDGIVNPVNSLLLEAALLQHRVPVTSFVYEHGGHGFGVDNRREKVNWIDACIRWIKTEHWKLKTDPKRSTNKNKPN